MILEAICTPALIYLVFSITQIVIDAGKGLYNMAFLKLIVTFIFTTFLNYLCERGLSVVSWLIVFIPFILMSIIISILLLVLGLDPTTGKLKIVKTDLRKSAPIIPHTQSTLLTHLETDLKSVDNTAYKEITELENELEHK